MNLHFREYKRLSKRQEEYGRTKMFSKKSIFLAWQPSGVSIKQYSDKRFPSHCQPSYSPSANTRLGPAWARPPESCLGILMMFNFGRRSSEEEDLRAEQLLLKDKWRAIFDQFDPEGFGEIPWPELLTVVHTEEFR